MKHLHTFCYGWLLFLWSLAAAGSVAAQQDTVLHESGREVRSAQASYIDGLSAFENGEYDLALRKLSRAYEVLGQYPGVNFALSEVYYKLNDVPNALFYGMQATGLDPQNKWYRLHMADIHQATGNTEAAIDQLEQTLDIHPKDTGVLSRLAEAYSEQAPERSNRLYDRIIAIKGPDMELYLQKLNNFNTLGLRDSSIAQLRKIRRFDPDNLNTLQMLSSYYREVGKSHEAKQMLRRAISQNPRDPQTLIMLSEIHVDEARWDSASILLTTVVTDSLVPQKAREKVAQYLFSRYRKEPENRQLSRATEEVLTAFTRKAPGNSAAHGLAADYYVNENRSEEALQALEETIRLDPGNDNAWRQRLKLLLSEQRFEEAIEAGEEAARHVPQDPFILYMLGNAHISTGNYTQAVEHLTGAAGLPARRPFKSSIFKSLADAYASMKQWKQSDQAYDRSIELNPENHNALNNYAWHLTERETRLEEAEQMAQEALRLEPDNPSYLDTAGWVCYKMGQYEQAHTFIRASLDTGRAGAEVMEHMGDVLDKMDRQEEARRWWREAYEKDSSKAHLMDKLSE